MSAIPDDIMRAATAAFNEIRGMQGEPSSAKIEAIAGYLCDERQRTDNLIEEVRKAADMVLNNPAFFTTTYEARPYAMITFDNAALAHRFSDGLAALRALLSRLEER